jgi:uncharacterized membrane protein
MKLSKELGMVAKSTKRAIITGVFGMVFLLSVVTAFAFSLGKYEKVKVTNGVVAIPVAKLTDKARFYKYEDGGKSITFFAVKAADGSVRTAFDACDACYKSKKGYEQQGDKMNCNNCNQKFAINRLGPNASGGCNPGYLPHQLSGGTVSIKASDLKDGAKYF